MILVPCKQEYANAIRARTVIIGGVTIGDHVENGELGIGHNAILTLGMRPYSCGRFATEEGALNYMRLVAEAKRRESRGRRAA